VSFLFSSSSHKLLVSLFDLFDKVESHFFKFPIRELNKFIFVGFSFIIFDLFLLLGLPVAFLILFEFSLCGYLRSFTDESIFGMYTFSPNLRLLLVSILLRK